MADSRPSDKAVEAADNALYYGELRPNDQRPRASLHPDRLHDARLVLAAAHDPALGLDRSVCLRDVVEALHHGSPGSFQWGGQAAGFIEREFSG